MSDRELALEALEQLLDHVPEMKEYGVWVERIQFYLETEQ